MLTAVSGKDEISAVLLPTDPILPNPNFPTDPIFPMLRLADLTKYAVGDACGTAAAGYNVAVLAPPGSDISFDSAIEGLVTCNARVWVVKNAVPPNPIRAFRPVP